MATLSIEAILERVQELKIEGQEKDDVIREQQLQISELETKLADLTDQCQQQQAQIAEITSVASQADALIEKLSEALA